MAVTLAYGGAWWLYAHVATHMFPHLPGVVFVGAETARLFTDDDWAEWPFD